MEQKYSSRISLSNRKTISGVSDVSPRAKLWGRKDSAPSAGSYYISYLIFHDPSAAFSRCASWHDLQVDVMAEIDCNA